MIDFQDPYIADVLLFTFAVFLFRLVLPLWVWLYICDHVVSTEKMSVSNIEITCLMLIIVVENCL